MGVYFTESKPKPKKTSKLNKAKDPRETTDLIDVLPDIAAAMEARYNVLFKNLTAPNGDLDLDTAFRSANGEPALECDHDLCWETGMLYIDQQRKKKMLTDGSLVHFYTTNDDTKEISVGERSVATRSQTQSPCLLDGDWYIGTNIMSHNDVNLILVNIAGGPHVTIVITYCSANTSCPAAPPPTRTHVLVRTHTRTHTRTPPPLFYSFYIFVDMRVACTLSLLLMVYS